MIVKCKFCSSSMRPADMTGRVLVCDGCGYFQTDDRCIGLTLYKKKRELGPVLDYPVVKLGVSSYAL